ncbi:MAG TPA: hypothetical protein VFV07_07090 [Rhizomicrobium sp.]|nr:hypothetical protein [Rhizomicrobium sp.]
MSILRSILAVVAGLVTVGLLSTISDQAMVHLHYFPPLDQYNAFSTEMLVVATLYRCAEAVLAGAITAWLAPARPMLHALILGAIGTAVALAGAILTWRLGTHWYPIALTVSAVPCTLLGGRLAGAGRGSRIV